MTKSDGSRMFPGLDTWRFQLRKQHCVSCVWSEADGLQQRPYLSLQYDNRLRVTQWDIPGVMGWNYSYNYFGENTGRVTYAQNINDATLDRSYHYDHVGRLQSAYTGSSARAHVGIGSNWLSDGPYAQQDNVYDVWGNTLSRTGWGGTNPQYAASYTNNKMNGMLYDDAGNLEDAGGGWTFTYDATGQQATSAVGNVEMFYDGDRLRGKKKENGVVTNYYLRSSVLGGQVVAELNSAGAWTRGYVYLGGEVLAVQEGGVYWMHQDPVAKSKRVTNASGTVVSTIELDPWGGETNRSSSEAFQPRKFTTYERDSIGSDEAMHRRYNRWWARFEQPDPYEGSYNLTDPQSFNRYAYVRNDPVNFVDPTGLLPKCEGLEVVDPATGETVCLPRVDGGTVTVDIGADLTDFIFVLNSQFSGIGIGGVPGGIIRRQPQNSDSKDRGTDCNRFATEVGQIAARHLYDLPGLANALNARFAAEGERVSSQEFRSSGFKSQFKDDTPAQPGGTDNTPNQVRHYVGGFRAFAQGGVIGRAWANYRESPGGSPSQRADLALNAVSTRHSQYLAMNPSKIPDLKNLILRDVCN